MSNTQQTQGTESNEAEERRVYHWRVTPSSAAKIAVFAKRNGMHIGAAIERAIDLLTSTASPTKKA